MNTGTLISVLKRQSAPVCTLAFAAQGRWLASAGFDGSVRLWDIATQKEVVCFQGHRGYASALAFSPDGKKLASGGSDTTIMVWDIAKYTSTSLFPDAAKTEKERSSAWIELGNKKASDAYPALWRLVAGKDSTVSFLAARLPFAAPWRKKVEKWIADLDSGSYAHRAKAQAELKQIGPSVKPMIQKALKNAPSPEAQLRLQEVLESLPVPKTGLSAEELRWLRAVQVLEYIGSPAAVKCLNGMAKEHPDPAPRELAKSAVKRLVQH
jgi:hypothetical protein